MNATRILALVLMGSSLTACATAQRLSEVGSTPDLSPISNPALFAGGAPAYPPQGQQIPPAYYQQAQPAYAQQQPPQQIAAYAQPEYDPRRAHRQANAQPLTSRNSLWAAGNRTFFGDPRAGAPGDILTVLINIADNAQVQNTTARSRTSDMDSNLTNFLGGEAALSSFFNDAIDPSSITSFGGNTALNGTGSVNRAETINLSIAAVVAQSLPNGNLVIAGRQEVRINNEIRELLISGVVRPEDINSDNTIRHTQIAEARISYGGRGHISDAQRPGIGQEIYDILWPF